jgi:hypothetical protein
MIIPDDLPIRYPFSEVLSLAGCELDPESFTRLSLCKPLVSSELSFPKRNPFYARSQLIEGRRRNTFAMPAFTPHRWEQRAARLRAPHPS